MSQMTQIVDELRQKYLDLRGLEQRTDNMLKEVMETFYIVEGLNRLQVDLDCLDLLVKSKTHKERAEEFVAADMRSNTIDAVVPRKPSKLKNLLNRSRKAIKTLHLLRLPHKKQCSNVEAAYLQLDQLTKLQRVKISELMKMVKNTIITNYGVLEQLHSLSDMHAKNVTLWENLSSATSLISDISNQHSDNADYEQLNVDNKDLEYGSDISDICISHSNESIITVRRIGQTPNTATKICQTEIEHQEERATFCDRSKKIRSNEKRVDGGIGDGQAIRSREEQLLATFLETKPNLSQFDEMNLQSCKSADTLRNIFENEFITSKIPSQQFDNCNKFLKVI